jgi:hypothetical protein
MKSFHYYDLVEALRQRGCAVCRLLERDSERFLDALLYEFVVDRTQQKIFRASRGLCAPHSEQMLSLSGYGVGIAVLADSVLWELENIVNQPLAADKRLFRRDAAGAALADKLEAERQCPCCETLASSETRYAEALAEFTRDSAMNEAFRASDGLCLPHFRAALRAIGKADDVEMFVSIQKAAWGRLRAELELYRDKLGERRSGEVIGAEGDSWQRAVRLLASTQGVYDDK